MKLICHVILCFGLATAFGCRSAVHTDHKPARPSVLDGTERILVVDRICKGKDPHALQNQDDIQESHYTKDTQGTTYNIAFSADGDTVRIQNGSNTIESVGRIDNGKMRTYGLKTFAGGRLVVWPTNTNYEAELTIFGSGFPIIHSERGTLIEKVSSNK